MSEVRRAGFYYAIFRPEEDRFDTILKGQFIIQNLLGWRGNMELDKYEHWTED